LIAPPGPYRRVSLRPQASGAWVAGSGTGLMNWLRAAVEAAVRHGQIALPSFAPGGPFPNGVGRFVGPIAETEMERAAIGALYLACMTNAVLDLIQSTNTVIVDGGLVHNAAYLARIFHAASTVRVAGPF
jgi:hypothetical protein